MSTPQQEGRDYEVELAKRIGGKPVPGSGAGFTKLDVHGLNLVASLKYTRDKSFRLEDRLFTEVRDAIHAPGGVGSGIGAVVVRTAGFETITFKLDDALMMFSEDVRIATSASYGVVDMSKRGPELLR